MSRSKGYWIKTLSKFVSVQLVVQALGFGSGILLVRTLSKEEYALFILANSMQGMMNVLADSGVSSALSSIGGKVWQDPYRFGQLINTAMQWRRYLAAIAVVIVTPILFWMLIQNGASIGYTLVLIVGVLIELDFYLRIGVLSTVLRLHTRIDQLQQLALVGAGSRLMFLVASFNVLSAGVGVFISTIASGLQTLILIQWTGNTVDVKAPVNENDRKEIQKLVISQVPNTIFFCVQSQLSVWLISVFGNVQNVAEIGALNRLSILFSLATVILTDVILPMFARCQSRNLLIQYYWKILSIYVLISLALVCIAALFPGEILWILGEKYSHLKEEVVLMVMSSVLQAILSLMWSLNSTKGWIISAWFAVPTGIITQILLLATLDISTVKGVLILSTLSVFPGFVLNLYMTYSGLSRSNHI